MLCVLAANAHHGFGVHYDVSKQVRLEGTLQQIDLRNPHSFLHIQIDNQNTPELWVCETQAKSVMQRKGITEQHFLIGQKIIVEGSAARREANHCEVGTVYFTDGSSLEFRSPQGRANIGTYQALAKQSNSIVGTWIRATFNGIPVAQGSLDGITDAGKLRNQTYSSVTDDPSINCQAANPMRAWMAPGTPSQIQLEDNTLTIQHEFMDARRVILIMDLIDDQHLVPSSAYVPNLMGYAYGVFHQDQLSIYSSGFKAGVLLTQVQGSGVLFSNEMRMTETFRVNDETGKLQYQWESVDPNYFPAGIKGQIELTRVDMQVDKFDCELTNQN